MSASYSEFQSPAGLWVRTNSLWGTGDKGFEKLFTREDGVAPSTGVPFPKSPRSANRRAYFDHGAIEHHLHAGELDEIDPRTLMSSQPSITAAGVEHYLGPEYKTTGRTFADPGGGNHFPTVYEASNPHSGQAERTILGGHHRATASLLEGAPLRGILVRANYLR